MRSHSHRTIVNFHVLQPNQSIGFGQKLPRKDLQCTLIFRKTKGKVRSDKKPLSYSQDFHNDGLIGNYASVHYQK